MAVMLSVIILNWNGKRFLKRCLTSLGAQTCRDVEVIVSDNASTDGSLEYLAAQWPTVRVIRHPKNIGYTGANNAAADVATGQHVLFLNNDTWLERDCLDHLLSVASSPGQGHILACREVPYDVSPLGETARARPARWPSIDQFGYASHGTAPFYSNGSSLFVPAELFRRLGGFDPRYFIFHEDVDFCWRARLRGADVVPVPEAIVHHVGGASTGGGYVWKGRLSTSLRRRYLIERNTLSSLLKNYSLASLLELLPLYIAINLAEALYFLTGRNPRASQCYLQAYRWNIGHFRSTLAYRRTVQSARVVPDRDIRRLMTPGSAKFATLRAYGLPDVR